MIGRSGQGVQGLDWGVQELTRESGTGVDGLTHDSFCYKLCRACTGTRDWDSDIALASAVHAVLAQLLCPVISRTLLPRHSPRQGGWTRGGLVVGGDESDRSCTSG